MVDSSVLLSSSHRKSIIHRQRKSVRNRRFFSHRILPKVSSSSWRNQKATAWILVGMLVMAGFSLVWQQLSPFIFNQETNAGILEYDTTFAAPLPAGNTSNSRSRDVHRKNELHFNTSTEPVSISISMMTSVLKNTLQTLPSNHKQPQASHDDHDDATIRCIPSTYSQQDISKLIRQTRTRWHALLVVMTTTMTTTTMNNHHDHRDSNHRKDSFQLIRLSKKPNAPAWGNWKEHFGELLIDGLMTWQSRQHHLIRKGNHTTAPSTLTTANATTTTTSTTFSFQLVLDTLRDYVYIPCMEEAQRVAGRQYHSMSAATSLAATTTTNHTFSQACLRESYPPIATIGSIAKTAHIMAPFLYQFPIKQYNQCMYQWRQRLRRQEQLPPTFNNNNVNNSNSTIDDPSFLCHLQHQVLHLVRNRTDDVWEFLRPQVYWRGSSLKFLNERPDYFHMKTCDALLPNQRSSPSVPSGADDQHARRRLRNETVHFLLKQQVNLTPRCFAAVLSLQAELQQQERPSSVTRQTTADGTDDATPLPWINVKFVGNNRNHKAYRDKGYDAVFLDNHTHPVDMSHYKYQIDFGGIGGTTWLGTIMKLAMPGLLFHHETPAKDWFHDGLQPWVHYVPIHTNLSNLHDMFVWAETHPDQAKRIAARGQHYAQHLVSEAQMAATFEKLYVQQLGAIVTAYKSVPGDTVESILQRYNESGVSTALSATCDEFQCHLPNNTK